NERHSCSLRCTHLPCLLPAISCAPVDQFISEAIVLIARPAGSTPVAYRLRFNTNFNILLNWNSPA
ncbi:MAG: hypothetical protein WAZ34_11215, partial [Rhodocyclaceae bacterium]